MQTLSKLSLAISISLVAPLSAFAAHDTGRNELKFSPVSLSPSSNGSGIGQVILTNGTIAAGTDAWIAGGRVSGLQSNMTYTVVVQGRFADPEVFSAIGSFRTDRFGRGVFGNYFVGLQALGIVQIRRADGTVVLQATRSPVGPGSIVTVPFRISRSR